jgi:hypothetical protein
MKVCFTAGGLIFYNKIIRKKGGNTNEKEAFSITSQCSAMRDSDTGNWYGCGIQ